MLVGAHDFFKTSSYGTGALYLFCLTLCACCVGRCVLIGARDFLKTSSYGTGAVYLFCLTLCACCADAVYG